MTHTDEVRRLRAEIVSLLDKLTEMVDQCPECGKELEFTAGFIKGEAAYLATHIKKNSITTSGTVLNP